MRVFKTPCLYIALQAFISLFGSFIPACGYAAEPLVLTGEQDPAISLRPFVDILEDRSGKLTFEQLDLLEREHPDLLEPALPARHISLYSGSAWWLRATIENRSAKLQRLALVAGPPTIEQANFHLWQDGEWRQTRAGSFVPLLQQQDPTRFPNLLFDLRPGETVRVLIQIKSRSPFRLNPVLYSRMVFNTASQTTVAFDGVLIGAVGALSWGAFLIYVVARRPAFLWLAAIAAVAALREAATRGHIQRLLLPLDAPWGYRLELSLNALCAALCALFFYGIARHGGVALPGRRVFLAIGIALLACSAGATVLPVPLTTMFYQAGAATLAACALGSAILLAQRARAVALLLGLSAILGLVDAAVRSVGSPLATPLFPVSLILESGTPPLALLATGGTLAVLTLWAAQGLRADRAAQAAWARSGPRAGEAAPSPADGAAPPASVVSGAPAHATSPAPAAATALADDVASRQALILGYVGHDLRAPLATISGYTRLLRQAAAPAQHAYLDVIERSVSYQFSLIEEILAYSKAELQPFDIAPEETDLPAALEELARFGIALCVHHGNSFQYVPAATLPAMVLLDRKRLRQAVLNLLSNAAKFTRDGTVRFEAAVQRDGRRQAELRLLVVNDGPLIAMQDQNEIFSAFRQLRRREAGEGLGLFIVERIAHGMGGTIQVESSPESGNRFTLILPIQVTDASTVVARSIHHVPTPVRQPRHMEAPPLACRLALARLARGGELSEIEMWIKETRAVHPEYTAFYDEVAACVQNFDMECLQRLALLGVA